ILLLLTTYELVNFWRRSEFNGNLNASPILAIALMKVDEIFQIFGFVLFDAAIKEIISLVDKGSSSAILYIPEGISCLSINSFMTKIKLSMLQ
ncbi:hypothetical protein ABTE50_18760, partial [Acinetobacter baumannii]